MIAYNLRLIQLTQYGVFGVDISYKHLAVNLRRFFGWLWEQRLLIVLSFVLLAPYLTTFLPPQERWFLWQRRIATASLMLHSIPFTLYFVFAFFVDSFFGFVSFFFYSHWLFLSFFIFWDFAILYQIRKLWRKGGQDRAAIAVVLFGLGLLSVPLAYYPTSFASPFVKPIHSSCEVYSSEIEGVRIVAYSEFGPILHDDHIFYLKTRDGGQNWEQVEYRVTDPSSIDEEDCLEYLQENP